MLRRKSGLPAALLALALYLVLASGCASHRGAPITSAPPPPTATATAPAPAPTEPDCPPCVDPDSPNTVAAYASAIDSAKYPAPSKISRELTPLLPSTPGLEWNADGRIRMATWTRTKFFTDLDKFSRGKTFPLYGETWFTPVPVVRQFCRELGLDDAMLVMRLEQLIGLPPDQGYDAFLEVWVDPTDLFRPCPDPEISDHECQVQIPVVGRDPVDRNTQRPWDCTPKQQVSGKYVTVHPEHLQWMCKSWESRYGNEELYKNYPWTALGYTYDWGDPDDHVGPSEYVAPKGSEVVFHSLTPTGIYCSP